MMSRGNRDTPYPEIQVQWRQSTIFCKAQAPPYQRLFSSISEVKAHTDGRPLAVRVRHLNQGSNLLPLSRQLDSEVS